MNWRGKNKREPQFRFVFGDLEVYDYIWLCLWVHHFEPEKFQLHQERAPDQVEDIMITYDNNISYTVTTYNIPGSSLATAELTKGHIQVDDCLRFLWSRGLRRIEPLGCVIPKGYKGMETLKNNPWNNRWNSWNWWNDHWKCNKKEAWAFHAKEITDRNVQLFWPENTGICRRCYACFLKTHRHTF